MKRFILTLTLCASTAMIPAGLIQQPIAPAGQRLVQIANPHVPAQGHLQLGDIINGHRSPGIIMQTILTNPDFVQELANIKNFLKIPQTQAITQSYESIVTILKSTTDSQGALLILQAFEKAIMHKYHYDMYALGSYKPGISIIASGIKWSWCDPSKLLNPMTWINDETDQNCLQLLAELEALGNIAKIHSTPTALRILATVESYRNWKRNAMIMITAYLAADAYKRGWEQSSLNAFYQGGLSNSSVLTKNFFENMYSATSGTIHTGYNAAKATYNYVLKPITNGILFGFSTSKQPAPQKEKPKTTKTGWNWPWAQQTKQQNKPAQPNYWQYFKDTAASYANELNKNVE